MRIKHIIGLLLLAALFTVPAFGNTNDPVIPPELNPLLKMLGDKVGAWVVKVVMWVMVLSALLAPVAGRIRNKIADVMNRAAETEDGDDDEKLRKLFSNPAYKFAAFILNFANIRLPTLAELERAIKLQAEAVVESKIKP